MLTQWHVKDPGHPGKKCRWQVTPNHADTLDTSKSEWADAAVQAECGNLSGNELTRNSSGNTRLQSSQLAQPLWADPGRKSGISLRELISMLKKHKNIVEHTPKILARKKKATTMSIKKKRRKKKSVILSQLFFCFVSVECLYMS